MIFTRSSIVSRAVVPGVSFVPWLQPDLFIKIFNLQEYSHLPICIQIQDLRQLNNEIEKLKLKMFFSHKIGLRIILLLFSTDVIVSTQLNINVQVTEIMFTTIHIFGKVGSAIINMCMSLMRVWIFKFDQSSPTIVSLVQAKQH